MSLAKFKNTVQSESVEQRNSLEFYARSDHFNMWRVNSGAAKYQNKDLSFRTVRYGTPGMPDICGYYKPKNGLPIPFFHEIKREGQKPTKQQREFLDKVSEDGCYALAGTFDDLMTYIEKKGLDY